MAVAFFNKYTKKNKAMSCGIGQNPKLPSNRKGINGTITVMNELNIAVPHNFGRGVTRKDIADADKIVVLLDKKQIHILPRYVSASPKTEYHPIPDSDGRAADFLDQQRRNRDMVKRIVQKLVRKVG